MQRYKDLKTGKTITATTKAYEILFKGRGYIPEEEALRSEVKATPAGQDYQGKTAAELKAILTEMGVAFSSKAKKADLLEILAALPTEIPEAEPAAEKEDAEEAAETEGE